MAVDETGEKHTGAINTAIVRRNGRSIENCPDATLVHEDRTRTNGIGCDDL
jgi:hypothetical protein